MKNSIHKFGLTGLIAVCFMSACSKDTTSSSSSGSSDGTGSDVATSVVSGAINTGSGSTVSWNGVTDHEKTNYFVEWTHKFFAWLNPFQTAWAATWSCSGGSFQPVYSGAGTYAFTPLSCTVTWLNGKTASSTWTGNYSLVYSGTGCSASSGKVASQNSDCTITRTTSTSGVTRTLTNAKDNSYAISHNTNGKDTGYSSSVSPAPTDAGVVITCGSSGCSSGYTLAINGSHLTGTVTTSAGASSTYWDHTVNTDSSGMTISGSGTSRLVSGKMIVQHNLAKYTSTTTFSDVGYGTATCCFPTTGSVTTQFSGGTNDGKSETLTFSSTCGEATLTQPDGTASSLTLQHCI